MSVQLSVVAVDGGYGIAIQGGELPNKEKNQKFLERIYKHKHVAVARKAAIENEVPVKK
jgi:hypothetical protein